MNEQHFAYKVRQHLNRGLHELSPKTLDRLASARQNALNHQKQTVSQSVLVAAGGLAHHYFDSHKHFKQAIAALLLLLGVVFSTYWIADQRIAEISDIDSALLSDELPIGAFTDTGFDTWLNHTSPEQS